MFEYNKKKEGKKERKKEGKTYKGKLQQKLKVSEIDCCMYGVVKSRHATYCRTSWARELELVSVWCVCVCVCECGTFIKRRLFLDQLYKMLPIFHRVYDLYMNLIFL